MYFLNVGVKGLRRNGRGEVDKYKYEEREISILWRTQKQAPGEAPVHLSGQRRNEFRRTGSGRPSPPLASVPFRNGLVVKSDERLEGEVVVGVQLAQLADDHVEQRAVFRHGQEVCPLRHELLLHRLGEEDGKRHKCAVRMHKKMARTVIDANRLKRLLGITP